MKITSVVSILVGGLLVASSVLAAPVESVESSRASAALQKIDSFLGEQIVAQQMTALGVSADQVRARLASLSDAQLEQVAAQVDLLQAGGTIQGGKPKMGVFEAIFKGIGGFFSEIFGRLFSWSDMRTRTVGEMYPNHSGINVPHHDSFWDLVP